MLRGYFQLFAHGFSQGKPVLSTSILARQWAGKQGEQLGGLLRRNSEIHSPNCKSSPLVGWEGSRTIWHFPWPPRCFFPFVNLGTKGEQQVSVCPTDPTVRLINFFCGKFFMCMCACVGLPWKEILIWKDLGRYLQNTDAAWGGQKWQGSLAGRSHFSASETIPLQHQPLPPLPSVATHIQSRKK